MLGLDDSLIFLINRSATLVRQEFEARLRVLDLTPAQWAVLIRLSEQDGLNMTELGNLLYFDKPTTTGVVNRLVKKKYVKKVKNRKDRRVTHVFITDAGKEALKPVEPIIDFYRSNFLKGIEGEAYESAKDVLRLLIKNIKTIENN
jgi:DNA-binding MarR family transcriptional regulator